MTDLRIERGEQIARRHAVRELADGTWRVDSENRNKSYKVDPREGTCTCPDYELWETPCKHVYAVRFHQSLIHAAAPPENKPVKKPTYPQNWPAYNAAQTSEEKELKELLAKICETIEEPPPKKGRPRVSRKVIVFAACIRSYHGKSSRRSSTAIRDCEGKYIVRAPHFNTILKHLSEPVLTHELTRLIELSAEPLADIETDFAADATGFGTSVYDRWQDDKPGQRGKKPAKNYVKVHALVGTTTNIITSVKVTKGNVADTTQLPYLLGRTNRHFEMERVSADKGYLSDQNVMTIASYGAEPLIPFKKGQLSRPTASASWKAMWSRFHKTPDEYLAAYHLRSNAETVFSAAKRKFGPSVRGKCFVSQVNEVLCKLLCHNLVVLIHEAHERGIQLAFSEETEAAE